MVSVSTFAGAGNNFINKKRCSFGPVKDTEQALKKMVVTIKENALNSRLLPREASSDAAK
jgi:hypothetical protein